jgi:cation/acetate symporter
MESHVSVPQQPFRTRTAAARDDRRRIEGRVAFAMAAFAMAIGLVALADAAGAPARIVTALGPVVTLAGLAVIGVVMQAMRVSAFYAGSRAAPGAYAGLAAAGSACALTLPFLPPLSAGPVASAGALAAGLALGLLLAGFAAGPLLRKSGAYSLADFAAGRFGEGPLRVCCAAAAALVAATLALVGLQAGAEALDHLLGLSRGATLVICGFVTLAMTVPGGLAGATWSSAAAAGVFALGALAPIAAALGASESAPLPGLNGAAWDQALARIAGWSAQGAGAEGASNLEPALALALALGLASLAPLLAPAIAVTGAPSARRAGASLILWSLVIAIGVAGALATSTLALDELLIGRRPQALAPSAYGASAHGLLTLCGATPATPTAAAQACAAAGAPSALGAGDIWASGFYLLAAAPELRGMSPALSGLVAAGIVAVCLALAAAGAQAFATALAHDILLRARGSRALTSRRLASARLCLIALVVAAVAVCAGMRLEGRTLIVFACALSAATLTPLFILALWARAAQTDALRAFAAGAGGFTLITGAALAAQAAPIPALGAGGFGGFVCALVAGFAFSFKRTSEETRAGRAFIAGMLHGEGDLLNRDDAA